MRVAPVGAAGGIAGEPAVADAVDAAGASLVAVVVPDCWELQAAASAPTRARVDNFFGLMASFLLGT